MTRREPGPPPSSLWFAVRFAIAAGLAANVAVVLGAMLPTELFTSTDIVGYPVFADYNSDWWLDRYLLLTVLAPILTVAFYIALTWPRTGRLPWAAGAEISSPGTPESEGHTASSSGSTWMFAGPRVIVVGSLFGLEAAIVRGDAGTRLWLAEAAVVTLYTVLLGGLAATLQTRASPAGTIARLNAIGASLVVIGVVPVSAVTTVNVASDGSSHHYPWFPLWLGLAGGLLVAGLVGRSVIRAGSVLTSIRAVERRAILFVTVPVGLFLCIGTLPVNAGTLGGFELDQPFAAARIVQLGGFPWRDILMIHGALADSLLPSLGLLIFDHSRWGLLAGLWLLVNPLHYVFLYLLVARLFERGTALVALAVLVILGQRINLPPDARFILWPPLLLLLMVVLERRGRWPAALLGAGLVIQAVLVPEAAYCLPAVAVVLALHDLGSHREGALTRRLRRTAGLLAGGALAAGGVLTVLVSQHAVGPFALSYVIFAVGHTLTGGFPIQIPAGHVIEYAWLALGPLIALLIGTWYYGAALLRRRGLDTTDWVVLSASIFAFFYYQKFMGRPDLWHAIESFEATIPLIVLLIDRGLRAVDRVLPRVIATRFHGSAGVVLLAGLIALSGSLPGLLARTPLHYRAQVDAQPAPGVGYPVDGLDGSTHADLERVLHAYLRPGDWLFDFSNSPGLYYNRLKLTPRTRYYNVSLAIPEVAQRDLIAQLERDPPRLVVFTGDRGLTDWDGIANMVRHYDVAQYILDHYQPLLGIDGQVLYSLSSAGLSAEAALGLGLRAPIVTSGLAFSGPPCDWGYAPNFLATSPPARSQAAAVIAAAASDLGGELEIQAPPGGRWADYRWLEIESRDPLPRTGWAISDVPAHDASRTITFQTLGRSADRLRVQVGSCSQWHAFGSARLHVRCQLAVRGVTVRLLP